MGRVAGLNYPAFGIEVGMKYIAKEGNSLYPKVCLYCKSKLKLTPSKTNIYCPNDNCAGVGFERLDRFFKKVKVDGLSTKTLFKLASVGIDSPIKVITMEPQKIAKIEGFTLKGAKALIDKIKAKVKKASLDLIMSASGIFQNSLFGIADVRCENIVRIIGLKNIQSGNLNDIKDALLREGGFGPETVNLFIEKLPEFRDFCKTLEMVVDFKEGANLKSMKFAGKLFAFSEFRDSNLEDLIKENGGRIVNSVSKNTFALFTDSKSSGKARSALAANEKAGEEVVKIVSPQNAEDFIFSLLKG